MKKIACFFLFLTLQSATPFFVSASKLVVCDDVKDPLILDPFHEFSEKNHTIIQQMMEGLVRFNSNGKLVPALAESWEQISPLEIRFNLRKNVKFHNEEDFDAQTVKFNIERYLDPLVGFPGRTFFDSIDHIEIVDPYTVKLVTKYPDGVLLYKLAGLITIVPPQYYQQAGSDEFSKKPIGTGPFKFVRWEKGEQIVLTKNERYWMKEYPKFDQLIFKFVPWEEQIKQLINGEIDIVTELPGTQTMTIMKSKLARIIKKETFYTMTASLNVSSGPLKDKRVRQAINYAINKDELIRYDLFGNGKPIATFSMPGEYGYNPNLQPYPYDPEKARQLLKQAGYEGKTLEFQIIAKYPGTRAAKIVAKQLEDVGMQWEITETTDSDILKDTLSRSWDILFGAVPDPLCHVYFIQSMLYSKSPYCLGKSAAYDALLEDMMTTIDPREQDKKAQKLDKFIYDEAFSIFTYQRIKTYGINKKVEFDPSVTGMPYFFQVTVND